MAQFGVFQYKKGMTKGQLVVDVQANLLDDMGSRLDVPLRPHAPTFRLVPRLNPKFEINGRYVG